MRKWIGVGRGKGRGRAYVPWLKVQNVPSQGYVNRIMGWKTNRRHEFLSNHEANYFYILDWSPLVVDIREQFPLLPLSETIAIAKQCGIKHPRSPSTGELVVMSTDFLVDTRIGGSVMQSARTVKPSKDLSTQRILEKFEIERRYWLRRRVDWAVITERDLPEGLIKNIQWIHPYRNISKITSVTAHHVDSAQHILEKFFSDGVALTASTNLCDERLGFGPGTSLAVVRHLLASRRWQIDMQAPIDFRQPLKLLSTDQFIREDDEALHQHVA